VTLQPDGKTESAAFARRGPIGLAERIEYHSLLRLRKSDARVHDAEPHDGGAGIQLLDRHPYFNEAALGFIQFREYIERRYYLAGTRISLDSVWTTRQRSTKHLARTEREFEESAIPLQQANPALCEKLECARAKMGEPRA
jgi:hypothetical protein